MRNVLNVEVYGGFSSHYRLAKWELRARAELLESTYVTGVETTNTWKLCSIRKWVYFSRTLLTVLFFLSASQHIVGLYSQPFSGLLAYSFGFLDRTQRRATVGRTPPDEWSVRRRELYLTIHNTHNRQTSMPPVWFEPTISAGARS